MKLKKKALVVLGLAMILVLALSLSAMAVDDLDTFPAEADPQSWQVSEDMTWDQWVDNPWIDWTTVELPNADVKRGVLIMVDFADLPFIMTQPKGSDFMGNPQTDPIDEDEVGEYWTELLNTPSELNDYTSIDGFWRENSYGKWAVEIEAFGPYHLEGMEWEYGLDDMNGGIGKRDIISEALAKFIADPERGDKDLSDFNFGFIVHAGYTESAVWQEAGEMMFASKEEVDEFFGPTVEELEAIKAWGAKPQGSAEPAYTKDWWGNDVVSNDISGWSMFFDGVDPVTGEFLIVDGKQGGNWAPTRYIPWTSFKAAKSVWSFTSSYRAVEGDNTGLEPGTRWRISVQSEDNGMGTFAHEFGHISGISDNYVSAYTDPPQRTPAGNWELMNAGNQNGPGGTHARYTIPARAGDVVPAEHTVRLKVKQGFYDEDQATEVGQDQLVTSGPVFETVVARNVPTTGDYGVGYGANALIVDLTEDKTPIVATSDPNYVWNNVGTYGRTPGENGYYENYGIEVIQRTGYESFMNDEGVLISMYRERESPPFIWVIDSHPEDINIVNFKNPATGEDVYITKGENRQLVDALFHAGTGEDVVSEYYDEYNQLHFYVLEKQYDDAGVLSYRVAVRSDEQRNASTYNDGMVVTLGDVSEAEPGKVAVQEIKITNTGAQTGLYRLSTENAKDWDWMLSYEVIEVEGGATVTVPLYMEIPAYRAKANDFSFTVTSEVSGKTATVEGTMMPKEDAAPGYDKYEGKTQSVMPDVTGGDVREIPEVDPQSWEVPENMTWADWQDNPCIDWTDLELPGAMTIKGVVILVDYQDLPFVMTKEVGSDPLGNPQIRVPEDELAQWWEEFLNVPSELNNYVSIDKYWRENSYGNWKIEVEAYGPYHLEGMEWEYGIDDFNGANGAKRNIESEALQLYLESGEGPDLTNFDFGFVVHAGYDESGAWQEAGEMMFQTKDDVPDEFGLTQEEMDAIKAWGAKPLGESEPIYATDWWGNEYVANDISWAEPLFEGSNYADTRYVPWTSWLVAKSVWSYTSSYRATEGDGSGLEPGTSWRISVQGESDGMATFAHEFGHIRSIGDNYNNPFGIPDGRSYTGGWEVMSRGSFAGPEGTHTRWEIPSLNGSSAPVPHTTRLKLKQEFYADDQYTRVDEADDLIANGPVFETIVAREVPTAGEWGIGYGVNSLMIDMDVDNTPIVSKNDPEYNWQTSTWGSYNSRNPYYGQGYYQFYSMEVVQRVGFDSFSYDEGVLIIMNREINNESAPYMWVIDAHPDDINLVDFVRPDGTDSMVSKGDARQLADALFHAGTGEDVVSEYYDEYNRLHFYVLDKMYDDAGVLSYRVAVRSDEFTGVYSDNFTVKVGDCSPAKADRVAVQQIEITNNGTQPGLYRLSSDNAEGWEWAVASEVIEVQPGETVIVPLYMEVPDFRPQDNDFNFTVTSEVNKTSQTVSGTVEPDGGKGATGSGSSSRPAKDDDDDDDTPTTTVPEVVLPFVDVAKTDWFYNDVLVSWQDGLVNGRTATTYAPDGNVTIAEAIKLAASMHQKHTTGSVTLTNGSPDWYSTYVDYAVANGIIAAGEYTDMNAVATRAQFASIFAKALPDEALAAINTVEDGKIPDVKLSDSYGAAVYKLYRAGVLTGNDAAGTFAPTTNIKRSEVAAIVNRMMHAENRKTLAL